MIKVIELCKQFKDKENKNLKILIAKYTTLSVVIEE
jgi:hypothetical protein